MLNDLVGKFRLPVQNASIINNPIDIELIRQKVIRVPKPQFNALQVNFVAIGNFYPRKKKFRWTIKSFKPLRQKKTLSSIFWGMVRSGNGLKT